MIYEKKYSISPSDLTFNWSNCHRCLWFKYNTGLSFPGEMPIVGDLASKQENHYKARPTSDVSPDLQSGVVHSQGEWVKSTFIKVDGRETRYFFNGKYDLLLSFDDDTFGVVDCKVMANLSNKSKFYTPQLEAYAYALENPRDGNSRSISILGLMVWALGGARGNRDTGFSFNMVHEWQPIERNPERFDQLLKDFITMVDGAMPPSKPTCKQCAYIEARADFKN